MIYLPPFRGLIRALSILCGLVFVIQMFVQSGPFANGAAATWILTTFGLTPALVFQGHIWQLGTWIFLHGNFMHLVFNILGLWMFGSLVEERWGLTRFRNFCILSGLLTGLCVCLFGLISVETFLIPTIGASGIVFACIMAVSVLFPDQTVLFFFVFPMKMKYFAYLMVAIEFYALWGAQMPGQTSSVSSIAHLSGALIGFILAHRNGPRFTFKGLAWFKNWRERLRYHRMRKRLRVVKTEPKIRYN